MTEGPVLDVLPGDRVELRKPHACGTARWTVTRIGADIGLLCDGCGRRVMLERRELERRLRGPVERGDPAAVMSDDARPPR